LFEWYDGNLAGPHQSAILGPADDAAVADRRLAAEDGFEQSLESIGGGQRIGIWIVVSHNQRIARDAEIVQETIEERRGLEEFLASLWHWQSMGQSGSRLQGA
jgi:hypothetical protein